MYPSNRQLPLAALRRRPAAVAAVSGSDDFPALLGTVRFYEAPQGVLVMAELDGLPLGTPPCAHPVFGFHIHGGGICGEARTMPFAGAGSHYDPHGCPHPYHAGDLPPLFGCDGYALSIFLTNRFTVAEVIGKTVIVHARPDDFTTQPAGNAGDRIACGVIVSTR